MRRSLERNSDKKLLARYHHLEDQPPLELYPFDRSTLLDSELIQHKYYLASAVEVSHIPQLEEMPSKSYDCLWNDITSGVERNRHEKGESTVVASNKAVTISKRGDLPIMKRDSHQTRPFDGKMSGFESVPVVPEYKEKNSNSGDGYQSLDGATSAGSINLPYKPWSEQFWSSHSELKGLVSHLVTKYPQKVNIGNQANW